MQFMKESVFVSAIRSFCSSFMSVIGIGVAILVLFFVLITMTGNDYLPERSQLKILPDAKGARRVLPMNSPAILCINMQGVIGIEKDLTADGFRNLLIDSNEGVLANHRVKALMIMMNSPGGTVTDSDDIYRSLENYSKTYNIPIYTYVDGLCCSGGMYVASASKKIMATPSSIIGSVGVRLGPTFNFSGAMEKIGISSLTLTQGKDKDALNPFRPWQPGEDQSLKDVCAFYYTRFVDIVTQGRPQLSKEALVSTYGANIYVAAVAQSHGYIDDANANYYSAIAEVASDAGIPQGSNYQVFELSGPHPFFENLAEGSVLNRVAKMLGLSPSTATLSELQGKFLYLYEPGVSLN